MSESSHRSGQSDFKRVLSGAFLVSGTAIGAGMLALPVVTALGGFLPACAIYFLCWLFMSATGLLLLEICLWMPKDANLVSMAQHLLGKWGKLLSWILYLFLFYCLTIAYIAGGGGFINALLGEQTPLWMGILFFTLIFAPVVYLGTYAVDRINFLLMMGLIVAYLAFVVRGFEHVKPSLLLRQDWSVSFLSLPVVFTSFSYQGIIPSLTSYLERNVSWIRKAILIGTAIPFLGYVVWEFLILGIVPLEGPQGLLAAKAEGLTAVFPLKNLLISSYIYPIGQAFAFFALTTSFLGVTLGLLDFLADSLKIVKVGLRKLGLCLAVFLPPLAIALSRPGIFLKSLGYAGGIGCALLLGLFPILMVWSGRYVRKLPLSQSQLPGGKVLLFTLICFVIFELCIEFFIVSFG
jgi:tyrosine-specific transport protein